MIFEYLGWFFVRFLFSAKFALYISNHPVLYIIISSRVSKRPIWPPAWCQYLERMWAVIIWSPGASYYEIIWFRNTEHFCQLGVSLVSNWRLFEKRYPLHFEPKKGFVIWNDEKRERTKKIVACFTLVKLVSYDEMMILEILRST